MPQADVSRVAGNVSESSRSDGVQHYL